MRTISIIRNFPFTMKTSIPLNPSRLLLWVGLKSQRSHRAFSAVLALLAGLAVLPGAPAVTPAPDGGYPGNNTAEGDGALTLLDVSKGIGNTAVGLLALYADSSGSYNTAIGAAAASHVTGDFNTAIGVEA